MRLTVLCVYGTLLALSSLSRTTGASGEGDLLGDMGFGPCAATLELEGPCRPGQEEDTCPYIFTVPPLTVHLPKQLIELEKIMKDLQKLKDNVDQLRKMCADCTVRQTERVCGTQREREHVATNEGTDKQEDERKWVNDRKDLREEFGTDVVKVEMMMEVDGDTDSEVRTVLEERGREKWKAEGERSEVVVKENEKTETLIEVALKDGKTQTEGGKVTDKLGQQKVPTSSEEGRTVDMTREKNKETEKGTAKDKKGDLKEDQVDKLQSGKERKTASDNKHEEKTEESDKHLRRDETKETDRKTQTEENRGSDGIKMSEDHDEHTNKEREQRLQDRKKKMERGLRVKQNNEKAKQTEIIGHAATQRTIKEGEEEGEEDGEMGTEIKPEGEEMVGSVQRDSDEDLTSNRASERTDFVSVSQTPLAPISPTHDSVDSNKATTLTSSPPPPPPPPPPSSSSRLIQDNNQAMTIAAHRITIQSTDTDVTSISEHPHPDAEADVRTTSTPTTTTTSTLGVPRQQITSSTTRFTSTTSPRPGAGFQDRSISTMAATTTSTPRQNLYTTTTTTTTTGVEDRSQWTVKKNASSNTNAGVKPRPKPGEKHKPGIRPEAGRKLKNPKNDHKLDGAPSPDKKIKNNQKQKPSLQNPTAEQKPKPGKDPQRVQIKIPDQGAPLQDVKNNPGPKHDQDLTTDKNKLDVREPKSHLKSVPPVQRPTSHHRLVSINATGSDQDPLTERPNSKPEKEPNRPLKADQPEPKQKPEKKPKSNEKAESDFTSKSNQHLTPESEKAETIKLKAAEPEQESVTELMRKSDENLSPESKSHRDSTPGQNISHDRISSDKKPKPSKKTPVVKQNPKPGRIPRPDQKRPELGKKIKPSVKPKLGQVPQTNQRPKRPVPGQLPDLKPESVPDEIPETESNKTSKLRPPTTPGPTLVPGATSVQRTKPAVRLKSSPKTKTDSDPHISGTTADGIQNSQIHVPPTSGAIKPTAEATHSPADTEFSHSTKKTITPGPMTSDSREPGPSPLLHVLLQGFTVSPDSRVTSDLRPQTAGQPSSIPMTTRPNKIVHRILPSVITSTSPGSTRPNHDSNADSSSQTTIRHDVEEMAPRQNPHPDKITTPVPSPRAHTTSTLSPDFRSTTPVTSGPEPPGAESSTPSARELRVKINQVPVLPSIMRPKELPEDNQGGSRSNHKLPTWTSSKVKRDCSDHLLRGETSSGVYLVTPDIRSRSFSVLCDMELEGGGWTLLQRRLDGSVSFNRTWAEYRSGFGQLRGGEFWLGNTMIHLLTRERDMVLRVELEDFDGVREHAEYAQFRVASERLRYRLTVGGYSGTAGDALRFSESYDHNQRPFTTPDRDNDRYPSGNCGAYYSSGWWFDACMAANLNGRYYVGKYRGVRDGIFWGTWPNISTEYYPSSDRRSFKSVRMMIRPKGFTP